MNKFVFLPIYFFIFSVISCAGNKQNAKYPTVDVPGAKAMIAKKTDLTIIDVRTLDETANGTIPDAIVIDVEADNFKDEIAKLDKSKDYLVYCRSGRRSVIACDIMHEAGFKNITNMKGGYLEWTK